MEEGKVRERRELLDSRYDLAGDLESEVTVSAMMIRGKLADRQRKCKEVILVGGRIKKE